MEALVHICSNGCRTIGPHDKALKGSSCEFPACKGIESLIRHFAACKDRALGGCSQCKRMWQLLELHSRLCSTKDGCNVPLCRYILLNYLINWCGTIMIIMLIWFWVYEWRHFKEKVLQQNKKDELKWKLLVRKVMEVKTTSLFSWN